MGSGALTDRTQSTSAAAAADNHDAGTIESDDAHVTIDKRPTNTTLPLPETGQLPSPDISAEHLPQKTIMADITAQVDWLGLRVGGHPALSLHSSDEPGKVSQ